MNVAEEFALLAYGDDGSPVLDGSRLNHGLAGALLLELALAGRVDVTDGRVVVRDAAPTGDALVDGALDRIAGDDRPRRPGHWVSALAKDVRDQVLDRLVADIFAGLDRKQTQARLKEIGAGAWAAASVKKTIEEIQTAVTVTLITAVS